MRTAAPTLLALWVAIAAAQKKGFNYGSSVDFETQFKIAQGLGFTSARLYTTIQDGTTNTPISAIEAAIKTKTTLLLGLWASAGDAVFANELAALKSAIATYGDAFTSIIDGISVGSEDLYRNSPTGIAAGSNVGANPATITNYINQVKALGLSAPIGHVDTWTAWVNGSNADVINACDFIGMDGYPYFEGTHPNSIENGGTLFDDSVAKTKAAVGGKPVWITETGWPTSGETIGSGVPSVANAKTYWDDVGCDRLFGQVNTWWYTLMDAGASPSFGVVGSDGQPLYDLTCSSKPETTTSTTVASTTSTTAVTSTTSTAGSETTSSVTDDSGGSPGLTSQFSYGTSSTTTGGVASTTGSGATATSASGAGTTLITSTGGSNSSVTGTRSPSSTTASVPANMGSGLESGALGAAFVAIMVAIRAL